MKAANICLLLCMMATSAMVGGMMVENSENINHDETKEIVHLVDTPLRNMTRLAASGCKDKKPTKWCNNKKKKCKKAGIYKKCRKTCNKCDEQPKCEDKSKKFCNKNKKKCNKGNVKKKCPKTCGKCDGECQEGWTALGKNCYLFSQSHASWHASQEKCEELDANLFEPKDSKQNKLVFKYARELTETWSDEFIFFWIGMHDLNNEGTFTYVSNDEEITWSNWSDGEPNNAGSGEHCVYAHLSGVWNDASCGDNSEFICEKLPENK